MLAVTKLLLQQIFVMTNVFVVTKVLTRQAYFCCDKRCVLLRQTCVCHHKSKHVAAKLRLTRQKYVCCNNSFVVASILLSGQKTYFVVINTCYCDKHGFVATKLLSQQKWYMWQLPPMIQDDLTKTIFSFLWLCCHHVSTTYKSWAMHHQAIFWITASTFKLLLFLTLKLTQTTQWVSMHPQFLHFINISVNIACLYIAGAPMHKPGLFFIGVSKQWGCCDKMILPLQRIWVTAPSQCNCKALKVSSLNTKMVWLCTHPPCSLWNMAVVQSNPWETAWYYVTTLFSPKYLLLDLLTQIYALLGQLLRYSLK